MIARIRKDNDFHVAWQIKRGGVAENLENVTDIKLERTIYGITTEHTLFAVSGDTITAEIPAEVQTHYGQYKLTLSYELVDTGMSDDDRKCKVAIYAFAIVDPLGPADDLLTVNVASDVSIGFKGDKGLSAYQVWLENGNVGTEDDYFDYLRQPATDAAASVAELEQTVSDNEALRVTAEQGRSDAELLRVGAESARNDAEGLRDSAEDDRIAAEGIRDDNEGDRINAESDREDAEELRDQAEVAREEAEEARANAEGDETKGRVKAENERVTAEVLRDEAEGLRELAEIARANAEGDATKGRVKAENDRVNAEILRNETFGQKMNDADDKIEEMDGTLSTYDGRVTQVESDIDQLAGDVSQKQSIIVNYTHTGNKEVNIGSIDFATGTITATGHGMAVGNYVFLINKEMGNFPFSAIPNGLNPLTGYFVINATPNTFQLSLTPWGAPITLSDKATRDYSKWHFESLGSAVISGLSLRKFTVEFEGKSSGDQSATDYFYLSGGKIYGTAGSVWITDTERSKIASGLSGAIFRSMANGDIWSYNRLDVDVTGKRASILVNGYRIYSLTETTRGIIRHNNEVAVHSSVGEDVVTGFNQQKIFNGMNIKVTKIL